MCLYAVEGEARQLRQDRPIPGGLPEPIEQSELDLFVRRALRSRGTGPKSTPRTAGKRTPEFLTRVGLESGPVVVEATGEELGNAPNVTPGRAAAVQRQTAGLFVAEEKDAHELEGIGTPVTLGLWRSSTIRKSSTGSAKRAMSAQTSVVFPTQDINDISAASLASDRSRSTVRLMPGRFLACLAGSLWPRTRRFVQSRAF
jgi:hypothetical protein